ncbi:hypothetical protein CK203_036714 [Vitis vinifera]|uniref:Endonuclease/exonuclease/phosphatase domain-containing protein n=1 Tax=Vitis vinifera TaxID=29760 RepID=A0A438I0P5_VITVI|nr:hypothetical protein CK203_036714 [Vitis vinifera]
MEGFLGRVGSDSRGSAAMVKPSSPETRGKGPSLMGNCVPRVAENLECPSTPMSPESSSQSLAPMENRPACPYQMSESVSSLSANLRSPCKESSKATVHLGGIAGSPSGEFQIEGLSPRKMAKGHKVSHEDNQLEYQGFGFKEKEKGVYGPNISALRKDFWVELSDIAGLASPRWCVGGDFNVIRRSSEKLGGSRLTPSMKDFDDFISDCELIDLPLRSASFTWSNMQVNPVCKRLDRFLYSNEWEQAFPQSIQGVLPRWTSDHWPIVLETNPFKWGPTPFRFENMWLQHPSFKENFGRWWREFQGNGWEGHKFMRKLQFVKAKLKVWNKASFGELKSIKEEILRYFEKLYTSPFGESWRVEGLDWSPISGESAFRLESPFTEEEIFKAIFQMDRDKALGRMALPLQCFKIVGK